MCICVHVDAVPAQPAPAVTTAAAKRRQAARLTWSEEARRPRGSGAVANPVRQLLTVHWSGQHGSVSKQATKAAQLAFSVLGYS